MDKREFYKRYDNWCDELFNLGQEAEEIVEEYVNEHNGFIEYKDLYDRDECPDWIYVETDLKVHEIFATQLSGIGIKVENKYGEVFTKYLPGLNPDDRMNIAIQLIERE